MADTLSVLLNRLRAVRYETVARLAGLDDAALALSAVWRRAQTDVRSLFHRMVQHDEEHLLHLAKTLDAIGVRQSEVQRALGQAQIVRGELEAWLVGLDDSVLDRGPGGEEWPVRRILGHCIGTEMRLLAEAAACVDGFSRPQDAEYLTTRGISQSGGTLADLVERLRRVREEVIERLSPLPDVALNTETQWFNWTVSLRFRLLDFSAHQREHIVQLIKTFQAIGHRKSEVQLILGQAQIVHGQLEARLVGLPDAALDKAPPGEWSVRQILEHLVEEGQRHTSRIEQAVAAAKG